MRRYRVFVFPTLAADEQTSTDALMPVVVASDAVTAAAFAVACYGGGPVECLNVVDEEQGPGDEGVVFFDCRLFADGQFIYAVPVELVA